MEQLEAELTRLQELPAAERLAGGTLQPFTKLTELIHRLVDTAESLMRADDGGDASNAFVYLEQAESWCDALDSFVPPGRAGTLVSSKPAAGTGSGAPRAAVPLVILAHEARLRTFGAARDAYRNGAQWSMCLRYAERVDAVNRAVLAFHRRQREAGAKAGSSDQQLQEAILATARSTLSVGGLHSKLERHNTALEKTRAAAELLEPVVAQLTSAVTDAASAASTPDHEAVTQARQALGQVAALRIAALYSTASELEHLERPHDAIPLYRRALHDATVATPLPANHPLVAKLHDALAQCEGDTGSVASSSATSQRAGRRLAPSVGSKSPRANRKPSSSKRSGSGRRPAPAQTESQSARKPPLPPVSLPQANAMEPPRTADPSSARGGASATARVPRPPPQRLSTAPAVGQGTAPVRPQFARPDVMRGATHVPASSNTAGDVKQAFEAEQQPKLFPSTSGQQISSAAQPAQTARTSTGGAAPATVAHLDESLVQVPDVEPVNAPPSTRSTRPDRSTMTQRSSRRSPAAASASGSVLEGGRTTATGSRPTTKRGASTSRRKADSTDAATRSGAMAVVQTMRDRELELRRRYLVWSEATRAPILQLFQRRGKAAVTIQCAWRCSRARLEAYNRRQVLYFFYHEIQRAAVAAILTKYRTFVAQRQCRARIAEIKAKRAEIAATEAKHRAAVLVIQRAMAVYVKKRRREEELLRLLRLEQAAKLKQYDVAAVIIQRWWPVAKEQRAYWRMRNEQLAEQRRIEEERLRKHTAATNISRVYRGFVERRYVREFREAEMERKHRQQLAIRGSIDVIRIFLREVRARERRLLYERELNERRRDAAAAKIQVSWAQSLQREHMRLVAKRGRLVKRAAAIIQRCYRRFRARRDLRVLRTVTRTHALMRVEREWKQERAVRKIQCAWRQNLARKCARRVKASYGRKLLLATWVLQRVGRGFLSRADEGIEYALRVSLYERAVAEAFRRKQAMICALQAAARMQLSVTLARRKKEAVEAEELLIFRRARREMFEDTQATKIQALVRGHRGRQRAAGQAAHLVATQEAVLGATIRIQCFFRKTMARLELHRRQVLAWKAHRKRQQQAEVAAALFATRVEELSRLEASGRQAVASKERSRSLMLVASARRAGLPVRGFVDGATAETPDVDDTPSRLRSNASTPAASVRRGPESDVRALGESALLEELVDRLEERESRQRNALLRRELQQFVDIFVMLQQCGAPELPPSATPDAPSSLAGPYDEEDDVPMASAPAAAPQVASSSTPLQAAALHNDDGAAIGSSAAATAPAQLAAEELEDLMAVPPDDAIVGRSERDAFNAYYGIDDDDYGTDDDADGSGLYD